MSAVTLKDAYANSVSSRSWATAAACDGGVRARFGFGPFLLVEGDGPRIHGNDERLSVENLTAGTRSYTEMLLNGAAAG